MAYSQKPTILISSKDFITLKLYDITLTLYNIILYPTDCSAGNAHRYIAHLSVTTQNLAFLSYWYRKKRLQMHF